MPDISLCKNKECYQNGNCHRYLATPSDYQTYAGFKPTANGCEFFIKHCKWIKRDGESCPRNEKCNYPRCT